MHASRTDVDARYFVTSAMRHQLSDNILALRGDLRLALMDLLEKECPDALEDDMIEGQPCRSICVDALAMKSFLRFDIQVRRWMVGGPSGGPSDDDGEGGVNDYL